MRRDRAFGHHVMMRLATSQVIAPTATARRRAAHVIHQEGAHRGLIAFRFADSHAHALLVGTREEAGLFARYAEQRLRWHLGLQVPFDRARFKPVESQGHLESAFLYVLRQEERHDIKLDPRHDASSAPDLLGMRVLAPDFLARVEAALPRLRIEELAPLLHLQRAEPDFDRLADAAAAALALPDLCGRSAPVAAARAAAVHAAPEISSARLAELLGIDRRSIDRLRRQAVPPILVEAVRRQLTFRSTRGPTQMDVLAADWSNLGQLGAGPQAKGLPSKALATKFRILTKLSAPLRAPTRPSSTPR